MNNISQTMTNLLLFALSAYGLLVLLVFLWQERMIFFPRAISAPHSQQAFQQQAVTVEHQGTALHGWWIENESATPFSPVMIYYGGNAEELSAMLPQHDQWPFSAMLLMNYRGYGDSEGSPSAKHLREDAVYLFDWLLKEKQITPEQVVLVGRSLGSGVAVHVASERPVKAVILVAPYDSLASVAKHHYPWLPVSWLLRHQFDSLSLAPTMQVPLLTVVGEQDRIIPPQFSLNLSNQWAGKTSLVTIEGMDHNTISLSPQFWQALREFVGAL